MPSPNNITDLIIFVAGAIVVVVVGMVGSRHTRFGRRLTGDWKSGPIDLEQLKHTAAANATRTRVKYVDPFAKFKTQYIAAGMVLFIIAVFVFYFMTKSTWQSGN
jgi:hypothetical protein